MDLARDLPAVEPLSWLTDETCLACGAVKADRLPPWSDDEVRALAVFSSDDPSCRSAALGRALSVRLLDHAWVDAHRGCAVSCSCGTWVSLLEEGDGLMRLTDRTRAGSIRCSSCSSPVSVVGVRARPFTPPLLRVDGITWCGNGRGCAPSACPLRGL